VRTIDSDCDGTMILRAWVEPHQKPSLRVRIVQINAGDTGEPTEGAVKTTVEAACLEVRKWLEQLLARQKPEPPPQCR